MDVDVLRPGQRFDKELERALSRCDVLLSLIGPRWVELLRERQASGDPDLVQTEIAEALKRDILVVPVLIDGAPMPRADALPDNIRRLVLHQGHGISYAGFNRDVVSLIETIRKDGFQQRKPQRILPIFTGFASLIVTLFGSGAFFFDGEWSGLLAAGFGALGLWASWENWNGARIVWGRKRRNETALPDTPNP